MIDAGQILIITAISIMTILLTIIGIQLIIILRDFRAVMKRVNTATEMLEKVGVTVATGTTELMGFVSGIKNVFSVVDIVSEKHTKNGTKK